MSHVNAVFIAFEFGNLRRGYNIYSYEKHMVLVVWNLMNDYGFNVNCVYNGRGQWAIKQFILITKMRRCAPTPDLFSPNHKIPVAGRTIKYKIYFMSLVHVYAAESDH